MFTSEKIEEWIQEVKERPGSAPLIIQFIAKRLKDLSEWNEKLRAENLALRSGKRVDEYERQISNLEYQLELIKRQFGGEIPADTSDVARPGRPAEKLNLLVYGPLGKILRFEIDTQALPDEERLCEITGLQKIDDEAPRLLITPASEELMFIFSSGRIITQSVIGLPLSPGGQPADWESAYVPEETNLGETLAAVVPVSKMALADFMIQTSRKGFTKKIRKSMLANIMENKFIGTGAKQPGDQTLSLGIHFDSEQFVLVSHEGYLQSFMIEKLPHALVEAMRLNTSDHLVAAFALKADQSMLVMTQIGKVLHRTAERLDPAQDLARKGRMLYSTARRESGVRVVGASGVGESDWGLALHQNGAITQHAVADLLGRGAIPVAGELIEFITFSAENSAK